MEQKNGKEYIIWSKKMQEIQLFFWKEALKVKAINKFLVEK